MLSDGDIDALTARAGALDAEKRLLEARVAAERARRVVEAREADVARLAQELEDRKAHLANLEAAR